MAAATREALGEERLAWLRGLPRKQVHNPIALVHASPESPWRAPAPEASDAELESVYEPLGQPIAVVGLPYDGDRHASYLLLDDSQPAIRRVEYEVDKELKVLSGCRLPHASWIAKILASASFQMP